MTASRVEEYQKQIRKKLVQRLKFCEGNVVVLFDELQKAAPGTLDGESASYANLMIQVVAAHRVLNSPLEFLSCTF